MEGVFATVGQPMLSVSVLDSAEDTIYHLKLNSELTIQICPSNNSNLCTGGSVWHASVALSRYLLQNPEIVKGKNVIELGSGCGLAGIVCAILGANKVILTDLDVQMDCLQKNINLNSNLWLNRKDVVSCQPLPFGEDLFNTVDEYSKFSNSCATIVIGCDIGYDISLHPLIGMSLQNIYRYCDFMLILAEEIRWKDIYQWYIDSLRDEFNDAKFIETLRQSERLDFTNPTNTRLLISQSPITLIQANLENCS